MNIIRTLFDYYRLRKMRISPKTAWQICFKPSYQFDILVIFIALLSLAYLAYDYWQATRDYELVSSRYSAVVAIRKVQSMTIEKDKLERVAIACLSGDSLLIDGVDRPCKVGEFKNERAVF
jgi:hypothetical protein